MQYIGVDLGTSSIKGAVLDLENLSVTSPRAVGCPAPLPGLPPLRSEYDPESFVAATRQLISQLVAESPACRGVLMCGQMGGLVPVSARGEATANYISWLDRRPLEPHPSGHGTCFDALLARLTAADWASLGREIRPGTPLTYLHWFAENRQSSAVQSVAALPDFVLARLCRSIPATHASNSAGAFNLATHDWHFSLFERLGFGDVRWPALRELNEPIGEIEVGGRRLSCYAPVGDHPCAVAGVLLDFDELSLNISTGSQVSLRGKSAEPGDYQTIAFFDGQFLHRISNLPAGRALNALVRLLSELADANGLELPDPWQYIASAADATQAGTLRAQISFFPTPIGDSGSLANLREENLTVGELFRAAFVNMAENYHASALRLSPVQSWRRLVFSGGVAREVELLRRLIAEKFRCDYRLCASTDETLQGLLVLALVASGRAASVESAMQVIREAAAR